MYCIDTSALVDGWIRYYPPDVFPPLWTKLEDMIHAKQLIAPDEVLKELSKKEDDLHTWAKKNDALFLPLDSKLQAATQEVLESSGRKSASFFLAQVCRSSSFFDSSFKTSSGAISCFAWIMSSSLVHSGGKTSGG